MKVVHVNLYEPYNGQSDYYFGSLVAIYDQRAKERIGVVYTNLCTQLRAGCNLYRNKFCTVRVSHLLMHPKSKK